VADEVCSQPGSADLLGFGHRRRKEGSSLPVTKELEIARQRHANSGLRAQAPQFRRRNLAGERIVEIEARCDIEHRAGILRRKRKHRDAVEGPAGGDDAAGAEQTSSALLCSTPSTANSRSVLRLALLPAISSSVTHPKR
jgi:hypothetical protein